MRKRHNQDKQQQQQQSQDQLQSQALSQKLSSLPRTSSLRESMPRTASKGPVKRLTKRVTSLFTRSNSSSALPQMEQSSELRCQAHRSESNPSLINNCAICKAIVVDSLCASAEAMSSSDQNTPRSAPKFMSSLRRGNNPFRRHRRLSANLVAQSVQLEARLDTRPSPEAAASSVGFVQTSDAQPARKRRDSLEVLRERRARLQDKIDADPQDHKLDIRIALRRKLSLRSDSEALTQRNILHAESNSERAQRRSEIEESLTEQLSRRASVDVLKANRILHFEAYTDVSLTWGCDLYDRKSDKPWTRLTGQDKIRIRAELNDYKLTEMMVHPDSAHMTRFH